jgi:protein-serine/threonine kinase
LNFPNGQRIARPHRDRCLLPPVSDGAIDLIHRILKPRRSRLSARRYRENDWVLQNKTRGAGRSQVLDSTGHIVFPNDAEDIKAHPFFRSIDWSTLHLTRPPVVPLVESGEPITKFFDDEAQILSTSDHLDTSSYEVVPDDGTLATDFVYENLMQSIWKRKSHRKDKKRPRDKALRDPLVGRTVLEIRKRGAFIGYTYRRPSFSLPELETLMGPVVSLPYRCDTTNMSA